LDGYNYPTWAMDVKISLILCGVYEAILPPKERNVSLLDPFKYNVLYIVRNHLRVNLKSVTPHVSKPHDYVNHIFMRP
jgi:hypothetical protein